MINFKKAVATKTNEQMTENHNLFVSITSEHLEQLTWLKANFAIIE
jgi:hypothetical protein